MFRKFLPVLSLLQCLFLQAQVPYTDYQNPFPQTYLGFGNAVENEPGFESGNLYMTGGIALYPQAQSLIFKKTVSNISDFKVFYANPQTDLNNVIFNSKLKHYYAFINTDGTTGCSSAGLKVLKLNKDDLSIADSVFFCDPTKPSGDGMGYIFYNRFYTVSHYEQYFPPMPGTYFKVRNLIRRIDTNLVMLDEHTIGDTAVSFGTYFLREAVDTGLIVNTVLIDEGCPMLMKLDTTGLELWRKKYYPYSQSGCGNGPGTGILGLQNYLNGYIALFNLGFGCSQNFYSQSIIAKMDKNGNLLKEVQYTTAGDTTLEFYSNLTNHAKRTKFYNMLVKTLDGNFAGVICEREKYGSNNHENYIVVLDTNLNIIHRSPKLGSLIGLETPGLVQGSDSTFYLGGGVMNSTNNGMNVRVYSYKIGGPVGMSEYSKQPEVKLYPNPAIDEITIEFDEGEYMVSIYNNLGQQVYSNIQQGVFKVDVSDWAKGLYLMEISDKQKRAKQTRKFIVE